MEGVCDARQPAAQAPGPRVTRAALQARIREGTADQTTGLKATSPEAAEPRVNMGNVEAKLASDPSSPM
jgi:hypothetical protein